MGHVSLCVLTGLIHQSTRPQDPPPIVRGVAVRAHTHTHNKRRTHTQEMMDRKRYARHRPSSIIHGLGLAMSPCRFFPSPAYSESSPRGGMQPLSGLGTLIQHKRPSSHSTHTPSLPSHTFSLCTSHLCSHSGTPAPHHLLSADTVWSSPVQPCPALRCPALPCPRDTTPMLLVSIGLDATRLATHTIATALPLPTPCHPCKAKVMYPCTSWGGGPLVLLLWCFPSPCGLAALCQGVGTCPGCPSSRLWS